MDTDDKRKSAKLMRKACNQNFVKKRMFKNRLLASKTKCKAQKHLSAQAGSSQNVEFGPEMLKACAEMNAITAFVPESHGYLQKHIRQLTSSLIHASIRVMEQNKCGMPHVSDIDAAAVTMGLDVPLGAGSAELLPIRTGGRNAAPGVGGKIFFVRRDKEIDIKSLLRREPAPVVYDVSLAAHWLAIDGVQPTSPQNPPPEFLRRMAQLAGNQRVPANIADPSAVQISTEKPLSDDSKMEFKTPANPALCSHPRAVQAIFMERRPHHVSQELMLYFRELTEACVGANETRRHEALDNAAQDTGLQPLLPYLVTFITEGVRVNVSNNNLAILIYLMRLTKALIDNQHISLEAYLHLVVPTVITCILCRHLCAKPITDNHWALRDYAAKQLVTLCNRYNTPSNSLYNRITRELYRALCTWIEGRTGSGDSQCSPVLSDVADGLTTQTFSPAIPEVATETDHDVQESQQISVSSGTTTTTVVSTSASTSSKFSIKPPGPNNAAKAAGVSLGMAANSLNTLYGILIALCEFGPSCLRMLVFPLLPNLCRRLTSMLENQHRPSSGDQPTSVILGVSVGSLDDKDSFSKATALTTTTSLSPADLRSMDSLKKLMATRLSLLLNEWRVRQGLSLNLESYKTDYGTMASSLSAGVLRANATNMLPGGSLLVTKLQPPS